MQHIFQKGERNRSKIIISFGFSFCRIKLIPINRIIFIYSKNTIFAVDLLCETNKNGFQKEIYAQSNCFVSRKH